MSKKIALFLLVLAGLIGVVVWQTGVLSDSPEARFARAIKLMEGLQSRAIPVALSDSEIDLLEWVYQDSLVRLPNVKNFRDTDKIKLIDFMSKNGFGEDIRAKLVSVAYGRVDDFKSYLSTSFETDIWITPAKPEIKRLAQSINTLTNDIRLTILFISWYENIRGTLCTTNDPENDIYISGELQFRYRKQVQNNEPLSLPDVCGSDNIQLKQHKCVLGQYKDEESYVVRTSCPLGCRDGACLKQNQSGIVVNFPEIVAVGKNTPIKISVLGWNGQVDTNYTGTFFIIVGGDDEAVFPTGALNIISGEAGRMNAIKFSQEGTMTVTVRSSTDNLEVSKTVMVVEKLPELLPDLEVKKIGQYGQYNPNDPNSSDKYLMFAEICIHGTKSINDLKESIPWLAQGLPYKYTIYNGTLANGIFESVITGGIEIQKNGECGTIWFSIQPKDYPAFDNPGGKLVFELDQKNIMSESNETNNDKVMYLSVPVLVTCWNGSKEAQEECDDGNTNNTDVCSNLCKVNTTAITCSDINITPSILTNGGTVNYDCTDNVQILCTLGVFDPTVCSGVTKSIVLKDSNWNIIQINNTASGSLIVPSRSAGVYSAECYVNGQTTIVASCKKTITNQVPVIPTCIGTLPSNAVILRGFHTVSRAWTYDSSPTSPYQDCSFSCAPGRRFIGGACV